MDEMPDGCCILQVTVAETGYVLRLWNDGRVTEAWPGVPEAETRPFDTTLAYEQGRKRFAERQRAAWSALLTSNDGGALGPFITEGTLLPGGSRSKVETIAFRSRADDQIHTVTVGGDLRAPSSLGPLESAWADLAGIVWGPRH